MKSYILLRANKELGPYLIEELRSQHLYNKDLVWIEGESTSWRLASEIDELKAAVKELPEEKISTPRKAAAPDSDAAETAGARQKMPELPASAYAPAVKTEPGEPLFSLADLRQEPNQKKRLKKKGAISFNQNFLSLTILLAGAMAGAFIIKQMVDNVDDGQTAPAEAKEIENVDIPASTSAHAAQSTATLPANETAQSTVPVNNDSSLHMVKPKKAIAAAVHKDTSKHKTPAAQETNPAPAAGNPSAANAAKQARAVEEEKNARDQIPKPKAGGAAIEISASNYKVGLLGGVSGLELSVTNSSGETAENVVIEVEFLKPNGNVAKSEVVHAQNIAPGASKKIEVPSSSRGVKVRYRLVSTNAKEAAVATDNM